MTNALFQLEKELDLAVESMNPKLMILAARRILEVDPKHLPALHILAYAYATTQQFQLLYETCQLGLQHYPEDAIFHEQMYWYYLGIGTQEYLKAKEHIERAIRSNPTHAQYYRCLGEIYLINREPEKAEKHFRKAVELDPNDAEYRSRLALTLLRLHKVSESLTIAEKALKDEPNHHQNLDNVGFVYALAGRLDEAETLFREALQRWPTYEYFQKHLELVEHEKADRETRKKQGKFYTPLYLRHKGPSKIHFDEDKPAFDQNNLN